MDNLLDKTSILFGPPGFQVGDLVMTEDVLRSAPLDNSGTRMLFGYVTALPADSSRVVVGFEGGCCGNLPAKEVETIVSRERGF